MLTHGCLYAYDEVSASSLYGSYILDIFTGYLYGQTGSEVDPTLLNGTEIMKNSFNWATPASNASRASSRTFLIP
jgi:hypothetical protein